MTTARPARVVSAGALQDCRFHWLPNVMGGLIGFAAGDAIDVAGVVVTAAAFSALSATQGSLTLVGSSGDSLGTLSLAGHIAADSATTFLVASDGTGGTTTLEVSRTGLAPQNLVWSAGAGGPWAVAGDWLTTGGEAPASAPGASDTVTIIGGAAAIAINGPGAAAAAVLRRSVLLDGSFQFGTLDIDGTLTLAGPGSQLSVTNLGETNATAPSVLVVAGTSLAVTGNAVLGTATITGGGQIHVSGNASISNGVSVDGGSAVLVGAGPAWASWLKVFAGATFTGSGLIAANADIEGIVVSQGLVFTGYIAGGGTVELGASGATISRAFIETHLAFAASGAVLTITAGGLPSVIGTLVGFSAGDGIDLAGLSAATASYTATGSNSGVLTISSSGASGAIPLAGPAATYAASSFLAVPDGTGGTLILDLPALPSGTLSQGGATARGQAWIGGAGGAWTLAGNWQTTSGQSIADAPGTLDTATIIGGATPFVVLGPGAAAAAVLRRSVLLDGSFQFGTLDIDGTLTLAGPGSQLSVTNLGETNATAPSVLVVAGTSLAVTGNAVLGTATITGGGQIHVSGNASISNGVSVDGGSAVLVGAGPAWASWLKVFAGATFTGSGLIAANADIEGIVVSQGLVFTGYIAGGGTVELGASGATISRAFIETHLAFAASGAVLTITAGGLPSVIGTLVGFSAGDGIDLAGLSAATASYTATGSNSGVLTISSSGASGAIPLAGPAATYAASSFLAVPDGTGGTLILDLPALPSGTLSQGGATARGQAWIGGAGGAWTLAGNWQTTSGQSIADAPGTLDTATIIGGATPFVVLGPGAAAAAVLRRSVLLDGSFQFGTLDIDGTLTLAGPGSQLSVTNLGETNATAPSVLVVAGTSLAVTGNAVLGTATITGGGQIHVSGNASISNGVSVDGGSAVLVGAGPAWASWLKVFAGATFTGSGLIAANADIEGIVVSQGLVFTGYIAGGGTVELGASGATISRAFIETHLAFAASGAVLTITAGGLPSVIGTLVGFSAGDGIDLAGLSAATASYTATGSNSGVLSIADATSTLLGTLALAGDAAGYAAATFSVLPDGYGGSLISETAAVSAFASAALHET